MKKRIFLGILIVIILVLILSITTLIYIEQRDNKICLMQNTVIMEYGKLYNPKIEELIDLKKFDFINIQDVRIESNISNEENKEYPAVGIYEIFVYYKDIVLTQKVEYKDTTKPELSIKDSIEIEYNTDLATLDLKNYITVSDLSKLKDYTIDFSKVNTSISGEYETVIAVEDCYGNKAEDNFKIIVLEKVEEKTEEKITETNKQNSTVSNKKSNNAKVATESKKTEEKVTNNKKQEVKEETINNNIVKEESLKCTHSNENWYNTKAEAIAVYDAEIKKWGDKWTNYEIDNETYYKNCPDGYEVISCPYCNKWNINLYY